MLSGHGMCIDKAHKLSSRCVDKAQRSVTHKNA